MKTVFWSVSKIVNNKVTVVYWRKPDASDALVAFIKCSEKEQALRDEIEKVTGLKHFKLIYEAWK